MRLGCNILPLPLVLAVVGVVSCAESFGPLGIASRAAGRNARRARRSGAGATSTRFRSATVKLGVGLLGLGSATLYLCSTLSSGPPRSTETTAVAAAAAAATRISTRLDSSSPSSATPPLYEGQPRKMLAHTTDNYNGVTIEAGGLPGSNDEFKEALETSLEAWKIAGKKGVWLKIPVDRTELVPVSLELGFELHHAEKEYVMLNTWLPSTVSPLPPNASHQVGIGALVLNGDGEVLVVREKHGPLGGTGVWKFPTGLVDAGEDLPDAAAREVLEETGIQTEFESVLAFRHGHRGLFGKSDLFFIVRMRLKPGTDGSALQPQESEIEECQWMSREAFAKQSTESGTVLLKELSIVMEAHVAAEEADNGHARAGGNGGLGEGGEEEAGREGGGSGLHAVAFKMKTLESSRKYGGKSMFYHGKL